MYNLILVFQTENDVNYLLVATIVLFYSSSLSPDDRGGGAASD